MSTENENKSTALSVAGAYEKIVRFEDVKEFGIAIAQSGIFGSCNDKAGIVLAMECLAEGCPPLQLSRRFHLINNQLSMKPEAMLGRFNQLGGKHKIVSYEPDCCEVHFEFEKQKFNVKITWEAASKEPWPYKKKGSTELKDNWATPLSRQDMLWARVVSRGVRKLVPGIVAGYYTPEELSDADIIDVDSHPAATNGQHAATAKVQPGKGVADLMATIDARSKAAMAAGSPGETIIDVEPEPATAAGVVNGAVNGTAATATATTTEAAPFATTTTTPTDPPPSDTGTSANVATDRITETQFAQIKAMIAAIQPHDGEIVKKLEGLIVNQIFDDARRAKFANNEIKLVPSLTIAEADGLLKVLFRKQQDIEATGMLQGGSGGSGGQPKN